MSRPAASYEADLLASVPRYVESGLALGQWWAAATAGQVRLSRFRLGEDPKVFGFYGNALVGGRQLPVMGNYQQLDYDLIKSPPAAQRDAAQWTQRQVREFALRYFLRVSGHAGPRGVAGGVGRGGFDYRQCYYKLAGGGVGRFDDDDRRAVVDLRRLGRDFDWVLAQLHIQDFGFEVRPLGDSGPRLGMPFTGDSYLVLARPLIIDRERPGPGQLGCYGLGYSFVRDPRPALLAYGPGQFEAAIELIRFHVFASGLVRVVMVFISNRPRQLLDLELEPMRWGARWLDLASFGLGSYLHRAAAEALQREFLERHQVQHFEALAGTLPIWRQVADWRRPEELPAWIPGASEPPWRDRTRPREWAN